MKCLALFNNALDDRFIVPENLRYFLSIYNTSDPLYFGHKFKAYIKNGYMQGGSGEICVDRYDLIGSDFFLIVSGYVLSKESLRRFVKVGLKDPVKCSPISGPEDLEIS